MTVPPPIRALVERVCTEERVPVPLITWRRGSRPYSTGRFRPASVLRPATVVITAASTSTRASDGGAADAVVSDQRHVVLHELAHHIAWSSGSAGHHDARFWHVAWRLYERYGDLTHALDREGRYRAGALRVASALGIAGAGAAAAERRRRNAEQRRVREADRQRAPAVPIESGSLVRLQAVRPRYLDGALATVQVVGRSRVTVRLADRLYRGRYRVVSVSRRSLGPR